MDRPTCGTCPHRMRDIEDGVYRCFANGPRGIAVMSDDFGCLHHPAMNKWLASLEEPVVPATIQPDSRPATVDDRMVAELEQWHKALVWCKSSVDSSWSSLIIVRTGATLSYVVPADGHWWVGIGGQWYLSRDAAMRAAESALGLPKCRVEGEP